MGSLPQVPVAVGSLGNKFVVLYPVINTLSHGTVASVLIPEGRFGNRLGTAPVPVGRPYLQPGQLLASGNPPCIHFKNGQAGRLK